MVYALTYFPKLYFITKRFSVILFLFFYFNCSCHHHMFLKLFIFLWEKSIILHPREHIGWVHLVLQVLYIWINRKQEDQLLVVVTISTIPLSTKAEVSSHDMNIDPGVRKIAQGLYFPVMYWTHMTSLQTRNKQFLTHKTFKQY